MSAFVIVKLAFSLAIFAIYVLDAVKCNEYIQRGDTRDLNQTIYWPWQVVVFAKVKKLIIPQEHNPDQKEIVYKIDYCGGALIDQSWVITSLLCMENLFYANIRLGVVSVSQPNLVVSIYASKATFVNNSFIGLIRLVQKIDYTLMIQPIRIESIQDAGNDYRDAILYSGGYGMPHNWTEGTKSDQLAIIKVRVVDTQECISMYYEESNKQRSTHHTIICIRSFDETSGDICMIDMGSPLVTENLDGESTMIGVSDFSAPIDCNSNSARGFTRIGIYHQWLHAVTKLNFGKMRQMARMDSAPPATKKFRGKSRIIDSNSESEDDDVDFII